VAVAVAVASVCLASKNQQLRAEHACALQLQKARELAQKESEAFARYREAVGRQREQMRAQLEDAAASLELCGSESSVGGGTEGREGDAPSELQGLRSVRDILRSLR
jgi:hypothetical protein